MMRFTESQQAAIDTRGTDILVAAAAGSGKTAVLVERIIQNLIRNKDGTEGFEIDEILVATFTNASARDMKDKIEAALRKRLSESSDDTERAYINAQLLKMNNAHISTLHSFCLYLVQNHYQIIGLAPNVRTIDTIEGELLLESVIKDNIETKLTANDREFEDLTRTFLGNNNIDNFVSMVKSSYKSAIANADVDGFLLGLKNQYVNDEFLGEIEATYHNHLSRLIEDLAASFERVRARMRNVEVEEDYISNEKKSTYTRVMKKIGGMSLEIEALRNMSEIPKTENVKLTEFSATDMSNFEKYIDSPNHHKAEIISMAELYVRLVKTFLGSLIHSNNDYKDDLRGLNDMRNAYISLLEDVKAQFLKRKRRMGVIDFNDYEHLALEILAQDDIRAMYQEKFKEIMIDEYQDTNPVQEAILQRLKSESGENHIFMVGDVKQSIYKFRQADPRIFIDKFKRYSASDDGTLITLNNNFRSSPGVINLTNRVFERIMDDEVGDVTYDDTQRLVFSKVMDTDAPPASYIENYTGTDEIDDFKDRYIVERIKSLRNQGVEYRDIVVLTRAKAQHITLQQLLRRHHIPSHIESDTGYFEAIEIRTVKSLLTIIDNPLQDDHLVGTLRIPFVGCDVNEIARVRNASDATYLYEAIKDYILNYEDALSNKLIRFIEILEYFQAESQYVSVHELIEDVYQTTRLVEFFSSMYNGELRRANLFQFQQKAREFEAQRHITLYEFLSYINELLNEEKDFGEESVLSAEDDIVRIMTIHKSKGLEFKNVIYYHLEKDIENKSRKEPMIHLHNTHGLAMKTLDVENVSALRNMHSVLMSDAIKQELYSEEMRLMYVAFTRAEERLILPLNHNKDISLKYAISRDNDGVIERNIRLNLPNFKDMLTPIAMYLKSPEALKLETDGIEIEPQLDMEFFEVSEADDKDTRLTKADILEDIVDTLPQIETDESLRTRIMYEYESPNNLSEKVFKESVTEIKRRNEVPPDESQVRRTFKTDMLEKPKFIEERLSASTVGTWMHEWMMIVVKYMDKIEQQENQTDFLNDLLTEIAVNMSLTDAMRTRFVSHAQKFLADEAMQRLFRNRVAVYTERPFIMNQRAVGEDTVPEQMVQGIIDLIIETEDGFAIIDYKTDYIDETMEAEDLINRYFKQVELYTRAIEKVTGATGNVSAYLYFFNWRGGAIQVNV